MRPNDRDAINAALRARGLPEPVWACADAAQWFVGDRCLIYEGGWLWWSGWSSERKQIIGRGWRERLVDAVAKELRK
jgi:hypothetical protein